MSRINAVLFLKSMAGPGSQVEPETIRQLKPLVDGLLEFDETWDAERRYEYAMYLTRVAKCGANIFDREFDYLLYETPEILGEPETQEEKDMLDALDECEARKKIQEGFFWPLASFWRRLYRIAKRDIAIKKAVFVARCAGVASLDAGLIADTYVTSAAMMI